MSKSDKVFSGSIPEFYDTYLVPMIFETFAEHLVHRVAALAPSRVLETAAGSGVVSRAMVSKLASDAKYFVTDLNQPMLDHARSVQPPDDRVQWQQADALALPFDDSHFDVVMCQFGAMFFPDRVAGYREARRVLQPGGAFVFNIWDDIETNEFANVVTDAAAEFFPDDPPGFLARTPHGHGNKDQIISDLKAAGFSTISIDTLTEVSAAPSAHSAAVAYCHGTPLRNEIEERDADALDQVTALAARAIEARWGAGPVAAKIQGHIIEARP